VVVIGHERERETLDAVPLDGRLGASEEVDPIAVVREDRASVASSREHVVDASGKPFTSRSWHEINGNPTTARLSTVQTTKSHSCHTSGLDKFGV